MTPRTVRLVHATNLLVGAVGLAYAGLRYLHDAGPEPEDPVLAMTWSPEHPWEAEARTAHLLTVPLLLFALVYLYIFVLRPTICLVLIMLASNLRLAVWPGLLAGLVDRVQSPPKQLFGVWLDAIDVKLDQRLKRNTSSKDVARESTATLSADDRHAAYRWNLTLLAEICCESIPQLALTILNFL